MQKNSLLTRLVYLFTMLLLESTKVPSHLTQSSWLKSNPLPQQDTAFQKIPCFRQLPV